jgi:hypothetical protein
VITFIHVCKRDEQLFAKWLRHTKELGMPDMVIWAEPGVNVDHKIDYIFQSPYEYPEINTHVWYEACTKLREPVLYLETDAWPVAENWAKAIETEYENFGQPPALITASTDHAEATAGNRNIDPPYYVCSGIGVYDAVQLPLGDYEEFRKKIPYGMAWDWWIPQQTGIKRTPLIRHSYGIYSNGEVVGWHAFFSRNHFQRMCEGAAIFHKDPVGSCVQWVDKVNNLKE